MTEMARRARVPMLPKGRPATAAGRTFDQVSTVPPQPFVHSENSAPAGVMRCE